MTNPDIMDQKTEYEKFQIKIGARPVTLEDMKDPSIKKSIIDSLEYRVKKRISNHKALQSSTIIKFIMNLYNRHFDW